MKKKLKPETGDRRPERKGRATGEGRGDFGWWIGGDAAVAVLLRALRLRRDRVAGLGAKAESGNSEMALTLFILGVAGSVNDRPAFPVSFRRL